ncbi:uncharacterized protein LOC110842215 isoform X2 [Folsomia candida]|uniref:uncharacterized protein LOC110842215 isoform X2 n=1 Tax=Folsomia candida TaxID=158441 RepID=UPI000B8FDDE6|nr:uncharacterized protein LOC110842215 isoform X2 [Folsomia candida]
MATADVLRDLIKGMRGKMPSNCLWHAAQALFLGCLLFSIGTVMSYFGFEADGVFTSNGTAVAGGRAYFYEDARGSNVKFSKLSYAGPIIMGLGGFIIVAACVMTFESRDSAAKVGPAAFVASDETSLPYPVIMKPRTSRGRAEVRTIATQTDHSSSDTLHNLHIFDKKNLLETFRKFSRTVRQSSSKEDDIHRCPSAPNLYDEEDPSKPNVPKPAAIAARRSSCLPKFRNRVPPPVLRQAVSIDCSSSSPFLPITPRSSNMSQLLPSSSGHHHHSHHHNPVGGSCGHIKIRKGMHRTSTNVSSDRTLGSGDITSPNSQSTSRAVSTLSMENTSSFGSGVTVKQCVGESGGGGGTVDLHLPGNGMVTLNVIHTSGNMLSSSSTCLRTLSPHSSYHSQSDDSSFDMGSVKSDNVLLPKSPMKPFKSFRSFGSESFGRPTLVRQAKVEAEIVCIPDSDSEEAIPEVEHESDTD